MPRPPASECWSTHELRERGWTPAMIRDLLGRPDRTRPSEQRVGRGGRRVEADVKLYAQDRVRDAEATPAFALAEERARAAQDRAQQALETRRANTLRRLDAAVEAFTPTFTPVSREDVLAEAEREHGSTAFWPAYGVIHDRHHDQMWRYEMTLDLSGASRQDRAELHRRLRDRYHAAMHAAHPWLRELDGAPETIL